MPLLPAIPFGGLQGLRYLDRTGDRLFETFSASSDIQREAEYFMETAADVTTVEALVGDRRLLSVVLGAFGLDEDIDKGAFIRKIIDEGTIDSTAIANRLVEPAYREMAAFLGFGDFGGTLVFENTRQNLVDRFLQRQFEVSVGDVDFDLRLVMNFRRKASEIVTAAPSDQTAWLQLLGSAPLREVVETTLNLPSQFGALDLDLQLEEVQSRASNIFGSSSPTEIFNDGGVESFVERFVLNQQLRNGITSTTVPGSVALGLLQSSGLGNGAQTGLFQSILA